MGRANAQARQRARNATKPKDGGVVRRGQRATKNGKPVVADGKGNWVSVKRTDGTKEIGYTLSNPGRKVVGTYKQGEVRQSSAERAKSGKLKPQGAGPNGTYNPNAANRKPSVEPGTNRLSRHARELERKERAAAKAKLERERQRRASNSSSSKSTKTTSTRNTTPAEKKPNPRMTGEGVRGRSMPKVRGGNNEKGRTSRLEAALAKVKRYKKK